MRAEPDKELPSSRLDGAQLHCALIAPDRVALSLPLDRGDASRTSPAVDHGLSRDSARR